MKDNKDLLNKAYDRVLYGGRRNNSGRKSDPDKKKLLFCLVRQSAIDLLGKNVVKAICETAIDEVIKNTDWSIHSIETIAALYKDESLFRERYPEAFKAAVKMNLIGTEISFDSEVTSDGMCGNKKVFSVNTKRGKITFYDKTIYKLPLWDYPSHFYIGYRIIKECKLPSNRLLKPLHRAEGGICSEKEIKQIRYWCSEIRGGPGYNGYFSTKDNSDRPETIWSKEELQDIAVAAYKALNSIRTELFCGSLTEKRIQEKSKELRDNR